MLLIKLTTAQTVQERLANQNTNNAALQSAQPIGAILIYPGVVEPLGTMFTKGQAVYRTTYSDLFDKITFTISVTAMTSGSATIVVNSTTNLFVGEFIEGTGLQSGTAILTITDSTHLVLTKTATATATSGTIRIFPYGNGNGSTTFNIPNGDGKTFVGLDLTQIEFNAIGKTGGEKTHTLTVAELPTSAIVYDTGNADYGVAIGGADDNIYAAKMHLSPPQSQTTINNLSPYQVANYIIIYKGGISQAQIDASLQGAKDYADGKITEHNADTNTTAHNGLFTAKQDKLITDTGDYYTATDVEGALQEIGADIVDILADVSEKADSSQVTTAITNAITTAGTNADTMISTHSTDNTAHADKFALKADIAPVASYTYTGNKEVVISAVDVDTNTFTSVAHGLANGDAIVPLLNLNVAGVYPVNVFTGGMAVQTKFYVINATTDTFQISLTSGGSAVDLTTNANMDLTKWHFEKVTVYNIKITGLPSRTKYKVVAKGRLPLSGYFYICPYGSYYDWGGNTWTRETGYGYSGIYVSSKMIDICFYIEAMITNKPYDCMSYRGTLTGSGTGSALVTTQINQTFTRFKTDTANITDMMLDGGVIANGTVLEVYNA